MILSFLSNMEQITRRAFGRISCVRRYSSVREFLCWSSAVKAQRSLLNEPFTSFLVRTATSWMNWLLASFVFSSSSAFCFSLNKAWMGGVKADTHFSWHREKECGERYGKRGKGQGGKEGRRTWSFCSAASSATWTLSLTLAKASYFSSSRVVHRAWSSPTFLSQTLCSLRTASASRDAASSLAVGEKWEWIPAALGTPPSPKWQTKKQCDH